MLVSLCFALLGGCSEPPAPYKLSYVVRSYPKNAEEERPISVDFLLESTDGDSVLKNCGVSFRNFKHNYVNENLDRCRWRVDETRYDIIRNSREGIRDENIPLHPGKPVMIYWEAKTAFVTRFPDHFEIETDKGKFKIRVPLSDYKKLEAEVEAKEKMPAEGGDAP